MHIKSYVKLTFLFSI